MNYNIILRSNDFHSFQINIRMDKFVVDLLFTKDLPGYFNDRFVSLDAEYISRISPRSSQPCFVTIEFLQTVL